MRTTSSSTILTVLRLIMTETVNVYQAIAMSRLCAKHTNCTLPFILSRGLAPPLTWVNLVIR